MLPCGILSNHDSVADTVLVRNALGILAGIVLLDKRLLSILDVLPVGNEIDVSNGISAKN